MKSNTGLVFGGGGARCFAHLGFLDRLKEEGIDFDCVVGSSTGALIAALAANNIRTEEIKKVFYERKTMVRWATPKFPVRSFMKQDPINYILGRLLKNDRIEKSKKRLCIVATDFSNGKQVIFNKGSIKKAVMASMAFPGIYAAVKINKRDYVDGGISNNIPADVCREITGNKGAVISSSLELNFNEYSDIKNPFAAMHRAIYLPTLLKRSEIVKKYSDVVVEHFKNESFNFNNWAGIGRFYSREAMENYYNKGKKQTEKKINEIKAAVWL